MSDVLTIARRTETPLLLVMVAVLCGMVISSVEGIDALRLAAVAFLLAAVLDVRVPVPGGGSIPLGYALAGALPALLPPVTAVVAVGTGVALAVVTAMLRSADRSAPGVAPRFVPACAAGVATLLLAESVTGVDLDVLPAALLATLGVLAADCALTRRLEVDDARIDLVPALPIHLTLVCGGVLVAVATAEVGVVMAAVAAFPLLITRFSFRRHTEAGETLRQTVQALGLVPELAGLAPLGHSERTAVYAEALAEDLRLNRRAIERIISASRLHHLGAVPFDPTDPTQPIEPGASAPEDAPGPQEVAAQGAAILRQAGFPDDVATLIESARAGGLEGPAPTLEAAVVRVASAFDGVVGDDEQAADRGLALVTSTSLDRHSRRAAAALLDLVATRPVLVGDAVAAGARFSEAASGLDLQSLVATTGGQILPFTRRSR